MKDQLVINSSNGWQRAVFYEKTRSNLLDESYTVIGITLKSSFWDREKMFAEDEYRLEQDKEYSINKVVLKKSRWKEFVKLLSTWKTDKSMFSVTLTDIDGLLLQCGIGVSSELISSPEKPIFWIKVEDSKSQLLWKAVIDTTSFDFTLV